MNEKQITVFGSEHCKDCVVLKGKLEEAGIRYTDASITDNLANMKVFLDYRDSLAMFDEVKARGQIGIPFVVVNRGEEFFFEDVDLGQLKPF